MALEQAEILLVLTKYLSAPNASAVFRQAVRDAAAPVDGMSLLDREHLLTHMERGLGLFLPVAKRENAVVELRRALRLGHESDDKTRTFELKLESDISPVRTEARRICEAIGASGFVVQKVTTIVSELARNMVTYAGGGIMTLTPPRSPARTMSITAKDEGTGIADVALVLSGTYRSKTGLGRGLLGCKRLADKFNIESGKSGTRIEVEVKL